ncbi:MAG: hypothetical protein ETSY1_00040 [Candidatus Entotheonella factor]|uniref:Uncharacterized protein n=1 Tax=Entotheonella factor TaxID=1429438 RepID=W4M0C8_ENTF1|nr:MAG: hypothetical protein ETSY1_00040 [Candidatus Entotheonella factor]
MSESFDEAGTLSTQRWEPRQEQAISRQANGITAG